MYVEDERDTTQFLPWDSKPQVTYVSYRERVTKTLIEYNEYYYIEDVEDDDDDDTESSVEEEMNAELLDVKDFAYT